MSKKIDLIRIVSDDYTWTLTTSDQETYIYNGERYTPTPIERTSIEQNPEIEKGNVDIEVPIDHEIASVLLLYLYEKPITVSIFRDTDGSVTVLWKGRLTAVKPKPGALQLSFESVFTSMQRPGLRPRYSKLCRHALYATGANKCGLAIADFAEASTLDAINGRVLTVPEASGESDGYYIGGMIAESNSGPFMFITNHVGTAITVQRVSGTLTTSFASLGAGMSVNLYPGCDHSRLTCKNKFNNLLNYGGFDFIPDENPFEGSIE